MMAERKADEMFKEFREHSVADFFKKNKQMLGYSSLGRALVTVVHEYVTNSLDACEEAGILPDIAITISKVNESRYYVRVADNGPGIPKNYVGKVFGKILAGTKFHRNMQQRGQQGIGAAGCTLFSQVTTGRPVTVTSVTANSSYKCNVGIDTVNNKPIVTNVEDIPGSEQHGTSIEGEFADVKYDTGEHSAYEYIRRTALSNPHVKVTFTDPSGKETVFLRAVESIPVKPKVSKLHPLGLTVNDLIEMAHTSAERKLSSFMTENFARFSSAKVKEIAEVVKDVDMDMQPSKLAWNDAEKLITAFKTVKWIAPESDNVVPIGKERIEYAVKNILDPEYMSVVERKPKVFRGGIPFIVEAAVSFGGGSGRKVSGDESAGNILRFANRVPLLFDTGNCAITTAVKDVQWKRYGIDMDNQPVSVLVNVSSVYIPYSGVGKEAIAQEEEIIEEIKLAVMDAARGVQRYISGKQQINYDKSRYRTVMKYTSQLAKDLSVLTGVPQDKIQEDLERIVAKHYPKVEALKEDKEAEQ